MQTFNEKDNLDLLYCSKFLTSIEEKELFDSVKQIPWFRVCYQSERHDNSCETPCYTNFFGGFSDVKPYQPIPPCFKEIISKVSQVTGGVKYNAILVRLYLNGSDNIAWHTDGRSFLGDKPTIASLSLGATCKFQMRKMTNVWPCSDTPNGGIDSTVPLKEFILHGGDLLVMKGKTQQSWHHRVPKQSDRAPRININFRYILPNCDDTSIRGVRTFYKYMVCGDSKSDDWNMTAPSYSYDDLIKRFAPIRKHLLFNSLSQSQSSKLFIQCDHSFTNSEQICNLKSFLESDELNISTTTAITTESQQKANFESELKKRKAPVKEDLPDPILSLISQEGEWNCDRCTLVNTASAARCAICGAVRGASVLPQRKIVTHRNISHFFKPKGI